MRLAMAAATVAVGCSAPAAGNQPVAPRAAAAATADASPWHVLYTSPLWTPTPGYLARDNIGAALCVREVDTRDCPDEPVVSAFAIAGSRVAVEIEDHRSFVDSSRPHEVAVSDDLGATVRHVAIPPDWGLFTSLVFARDHVIGFVAQNHGSGPGFAVHELESSITTRGLVADADPFPSADGSLVSVGWIADDTIAITTLHPDTGVVDRVDLPCSNGAPCHYADIPIAPHVPAGSHGEWFRTSDGDTFTFQSERCTLRASVSRRSIDVDCTLHNAAPDPRPPAAGPYGFSPVVEWAGGWHRVGLLAGQLPGSLGEFAVVRMLDADRAFAILKWVVHPDPTHPERWQTILVSAAIPAKLD